MANPAYPKDLNDLEDNLLKTRRGSDDLTNKIGFGLSGGGIRSATFCLGIFQGLAKQELPQPQSQPRSEDVVVEDRLSINGLRRWILRIVLRTPVYTQGGR